MEVVSKKCYKPKIFILPSGKEIKCQGYEPFALNELIETFEEDEIVTGCKNVPSIWYNDEKDKKHRHYVDIFIPSKNKCLEVKSSWTIKNKNANIFLHLFSFKTPIINKIENSLKLFSIIIQNGKSYVENVKISKSR